MNIDESVALTQTQLTSEGKSMGDLLAKFRPQVSPILINDSAWQNILDCARSLPISMGAQPFGFELPLHTHTPIADFGATLESGNCAASVIQRRTQIDKNDAVANALARLFKKMDTKGSQLRDIVGHKLMLEFDIGSAEVGTSSFPGIFLRPDLQPIAGPKDRAEDIRTVSEALAAAVGWELSDTQFEVMSRVCQAQPEDVRMDTFGIFPARSPAIRLGIMGFQSRKDISEFLKTTEWPGCVSTVDSIIARFKERTPIITGLNIDATKNSLGPTLGVTFTIKQRYTNNSRYWLDDPGDWNPILRVLSEEELIVDKKIQALAGWVVKPTMLFGRAGRYFLLRGIHHIKLVICDGRLSGAKAYVFLVLAAT